MGDADVDDLLEAPFKEKEEAVRLSTPFEAPLHVWMPR